MAKSNRRRKLDRAKRQVRDAQRQVVAERRLAAVETLQDIIGRYGRLFQPDAPVAELVSLLNEHRGGGPVSITLVNRMLADGSSPERLAEAAEMMLAPDGVDESTPSLTALTFAAEVARAEGKAERARELLDQALAVGADDPERRMNLLDHMRLNGRVADGLALLEAVLRDVPDYGRAAEHYGLAIQEAYTRVNDQRPSEQCSCGRGASWQECCGPRERAALSRFTDRSGMTAISDAVAGFLINSEYGRAVHDQVAGSVADYDDLDWDPDALASFRELLAEHALLRAKPSADDLGDEVDQEDGQVPGPLAALVADPSVPRDLAAKADVWRLYIHYGLWRIDSQSAAPGLWCTDICSGAVRYAEFPAGLSSGWPRWSVWLGALVPVDGIWRATGAGLRLSPAEADAAAEFVEAASASIVPSVAGKRKRSTRAAEPLRFGNAEPLGVMVDWRERASSDMALLIGVVVGYMLPRIVGEVHLNRQPPPALRNRDGDVICLITAEIAVNDSEQVSDRLAARPGFERDPDNPAHINWYGIRISEAERQEMLAEATAQPGVLGLADAYLDDPAEPQWWVRGTISLGTGKILAAVDSEKLFTRLLDVLSKIGAAPTVTAEERIDPAQDFDWREKDWLDEQVPALGGLTPRQATEGKENLMLEAMLRQFEYEADVLAAQGKQGIDTDWLRQELDMTDDTGD